MKPNPDNLMRARRLYDLGEDASADLAMCCARGHQHVPAQVHDQVREERATRVWFMHRQGGWTPTDVVLRSTLYETEMWFDPRGQSTLLSADYAEIEKRILFRVTDDVTRDLSFAEMYGTPGLQNYWMLDDPDKDTTITGRRRR